MQPGKLQAELRGSKQFAYTAEGIEHLLEQTSIEAIFVIARKRS